MPKLNPQAKELVVEIAEEIKQIAEGKVVKGEISSLLDSVLAQPISDSRPKIPATILSLVTAQEQNTDEDSFTEVDEAIDEFLGFNEEEGKILITDICGICFDPVCKCPDRRINDVRIVK